MILQKAVSRMSRSMEGESHTEKSCPLIPAESQGPLSGITGAMNDVLQRQTSVNTIMETLRGFCGVVLVQNCKIRFS